ncbi:type II toxin-antitoxin system VapB family antitoxin [Leucothrix pacifica]|uniref:DUF2191 domain-containing protein n=1 Tax=Leucothrix pacifica TaxID=1247513 RepID=A0A317CHE0_9GAMM|nr:type II toxin-antitoxin system VapB family antitoxin [Leucothrix pacifica]PWQ95662.1 DUF2191 domain-containing protein [Leucothrix pacifica]
MKTTVSIDEKLISDVLKETGIKSKREAVEQSLRHLLSLTRQKRIKPEEIKKSRGKLNWS